MAVTPACASCVLGATSTNLLSFTYKAVETITVTVNTYITEYPGGSRTTNYESITQTETDYVGGGSSGASKTFDKLDDLVWTVAGTVLTYPTTYVQYCGFEGGVATEDTCASAGDATAVGLPANTDPSSLIYPYDGSASILPPELLAYLGSLPLVSQQFEGAAVTGCAPVNYVPKTSAEKRAVEPVVTAAPAETFPQLELRYVNHTTNGTLGGNATATGPTTKNNQSHPPKAPPPPKLTTHAPNEYTTYTTESSLAVYPVPSNPHQTAFVLEPISGKTIVTTETAAGAHTTNKPGKPSDSYPNGPDRPSNQQNPHEHNHGPGDNPSNEHDNPPGSGRPSSNQGPGSHENHPNGGQGHDRPDPGGNDSPPVYSGGNTQVTANSNGAVVIGGKTIRPGQTATIGTGGGKTVVSLPTNGGKTHLVVGGSTYKPQPGPGPITAEPGQATAIITRDGHSITAIQVGGGKVVLRDGSSTTTVAPGAKATFEGQTIHVPSRGSSIEVNGKPAQLTAGSGLPQAVFTAGDHTFTVFDDQGSATLKDSSTSFTLQDGAWTTIDGHGITMGPEGGSIIVDDKTTLVSPVTAPSAVITADGSTITAIDKSGSVLLVDGTHTATVNDGDTITFEGEEISIPTSGANVVVDGTTFTMSGSSTGISDYITKGLGGADSSPSSNSPAKAIDNAATAVELPPFRAAGLALIFGFVGMCLFL